MSDIVPSPPSSSSTPSSFDRWRRQFGLITGLGLSEDERMKAMDMLHYKRCEDWKRELMSTSPAIVFMLKHLKLSGCNVTPNHVQCGPCDLTRSGGFVPEGVVLLCQGQYFSKRHMEDTLTHELVHMYDQCKFKVDWSNLRHHACSEIRANSLGGDCRWSRELRRMNFSFSKQHQACVRRRAIISVANNPSCPNEAAAEQAVNEVWESCFNDTRPFDEIY